MPDERPTVDSSRPPSAESAIAALTRQLSALRSLLEDLEDRDYAERREAFCGASIGAHVRHALDHIDSLGASVTTGVIDYDHRCRGTDVEIDRRAGIRAIDRAAEVLDSMDRRDADGAIELRVMVDPRGATVVTPSTLAREIVFTLSHTIHHAAIISAMARISGAVVPAGFGLAPSTIRHHDSDAGGPAAGDSSCAR